MGFRALSAERVHADPMILPSERPEQGPLGLAEDRRAFNRLLAFVRSLAPRETDTVKPDWTTEGVMYHGSSQAEVTGGEVQQMVVVKVHEDYLTCRSLDIFANGERAEGSDDIDVAKPFELRLSSWRDNTIGQRSYVEYTGSEAIGTETDGTDAQIRNFRTNDGATDEHDVQEYVDPAYISRVQTTVGEVTTTVTEGSVIYAAKVTGVVTVLEAVESELVMTKTVEWVDVNADGRHWDQKYRDVSACVDGVAKRIRIRCSAFFDPPEE